MGTNQNVNVHNNRFDIVNLTIDDPEVVRAIAEADDPEQAVRLCLAIGARMYTASRTTLDVHVVERHFEDLQRTFGETVKHGVEQLAETSTALLDHENGALTTVLTDLRSNIEAMLQQHFDPESRRSVSATMATMFEEVSRKQEDRIKGFLANHPDSPLGAVKSELLTALRETSESLRTPVMEVAKALAVSDQTAALHEKTASKGFDYEDLVHGHIGRLAAPFGDVPYDTSDESGAAGRKMGDTVVHVPTPGTGPGCLVVESKDTNLSMTATVRELEAAMNNREAQVGLIVFSSQANAPTSVPFHIIGEGRAVVVLDKSTGDTSALHLGYLWARWVLQRSTSADILDTRRLESAITRVQDSLKRASVIRRSITNIEKDAGSVRSGLDEMTDIISQELGSLSEMLETDLAA